MRSLFMSGAIGLMVMAAFGCGAAGPGPTGGGGGTGGGAPTGGGTGGSEVVVSAGGVVQLTNSSNYTFYRFFLSPTSQSTWGPDQLGDGVLPPGSTVTLSNVACDSYDVKIVDEDGDECVVNGVRVCGGTAWDVSNDDLLRCEGFR